MLEYKENELYVENVSLRHACERFGTPAYVYSKAKVEERVAFVLTGLQQNGARVHFPVKCNFNLAILDLLRRQGLSFDVSSEGELRRVLKVGADPSKVVFTGVGKTRREIEFALEAGIGCFHVESRQELEVIEEVARRRNVASTSLRHPRNVKAPIAVRVNVNVATKTHGYITTGSGSTKFGIPIDEAEDAYLFANSSVHLSIQGIHCHIGSQITDVAPYREAISLVLPFVEKLREKGIFLKFFDIGGGFGVRYRPDDPFLPWDKWLPELVRPIWDMGLEVHLEPGRVIMAESGVLVTEVLYTKKMAGKYYVIVDAAMNDFIRPALYDGYHEILKVRIDDGDKALDARRRDVGKSVENNDAKLVAQYSDAELDIQTNDAESGALNCPCKLDVQIKDVELHTRYGDAKLDFQNKDAELGYGDSELDVQNNDVELDARCIVDKLCVQNNDDESDVRFSNSKLGVQIDDVELDAHRYGDNNSDVQNNCAELGARYGDAESSVRNERTESAIRNGDGELCDIVGPLCESSDILGLNRRLPSVGRGDLLVVSMAGAYGSAIMSNFSSRPRPAEVLVDGTSVCIIKERETYDHVMRLDRMQLTDDAPQM